MHAARTRERAPAAVLLRRDGTECATPRYGASVEPRVRARGRARTAGTSDAGGGAGARHQLHLVQRPNTALPHFVAG